MFEEFEQTIKKENHSKELKKCYLGKQILQEEVISNTAAKDKSKKNCPVILNILITRDFI